MKKLILFIALGVFFSSCDIGSDDTTNYAFDLVPVSSVTMPATFAKDSTTNIPVKYIRPSNCHLFDSFYYEKDGFTRTVAINCVRFLQDNCQTDNATEIEVNLPFRPIELGTYHFKFYTGRDSSNVAQFLEYDVVVDH